MKSKFSDKNTFASDDQRWQAICERDKSADGSFFIGVTTTGIFCRPGCPARTPNRKNIIFLDSVQQALKVGFRACKRCRPCEENAESELMNKLNKVRSIIENAETEPNLETLASAVKLSPSHLHRSFKKCFGITPKTYANAIKLNRLENSLSKGSSVTAAIYDAGYGSASTAYEQIKRHFAMQPSQLKKARNDTSLIYAIRKCNLGWLGIAASAKGLCCILFADTAKETEDLLKARFPNIKMSANPKLLNVALNEIINLINHPDYKCNLPLELRGTAFQQKVWKALQALKPGQTVTYTDIAKAIDAPSSTRAVANACGANKLAVIVPCHRVIRKDGELGGYRWGIKRKEQLLAAETALKTEKNKK